MYIYIYTYKKIGDLSNTIIDPCDSEKNGREKNYVSRLWLEKKQLRDVSM